VGGSVGKIEVDRTEMVDRPTIPEAARPTRRAGRGRTVGLTPRIQQIIRDAIAAGNYQKVAAQAAGISEDTLMKWRQRGRRGVEPYASLEKAIEVADQDCEMTLVAKVMGATDKDWRAAAMMLERKYPERWSKMREREWEANGLTARGFEINIHLGIGENAPAVIETVAEALPAPREKDPNPDLN
jgi:hypothetical protein